MLNYGESFWSISSVLTVCTTLCLELSDSSIHCSRTKTNVFNTNQVCKKSFNHSFSLFITRILSIFLVCTET